MASDSQRTCRQKKKKEIEREEQRSPEQKELAPSTGPELEEEKKKRYFQPQVEKIV